ncbi:hypothetical protein RclHR1_09520007 [Rhizophagus clarus]|uniref:F-box domain-containing protein n=1 Tax=Rhizophagus clarus TaxID=94130 RepID=A0A2Z6SIQ6_9GLOM|nr:hypothetical protein RclHR1_09520007 [Rhizophagus clarus]GES91069.1 hypothetical protein GLOIN_2v1549563 [Rhizophagus clarus]
MSLLPADCLNEIFKYLDNDTNTLNSCILVNRLWCEVSVRILCQNYSTSKFSTLIAYLPNESKEVLYKNRINISTLTLKISTFNYNQIYKKLELLLNQQSISLQKLNVNVNITAQEIIKLFINQILPLKQLDLSKFWQFLTWQTPTTYFVSHPEAKDCLKNLSEFFHQLSQIWHIILSLDIKIVNYIPSELVDLISFQKDLKYLNVEMYNMLDSITLLMKKLPNTLTKLEFYGIGYISLSFIIKLTNLQELQLELLYSEWFKNFEILQNPIFLQLQIVNH